jgi:hypothetical protein
MLLEARRQCQKCLLLLCLLASLRAEWNTKDFQKREHSLGMKHFYYSFFSPSPYDDESSRKQGCGSGIRCFFDPWIRVPDPENVFSRSRIRNRFIPDLGSRIPNPYF